MSKLHWMALAALLAAPFASAHAQAVKETIAGHSTWVYTPAKTLDGGKRGLLVALHGCAQTNDQIWKAGNLQATADATGLVVAVPAVGTGYLAGCWNYDGANDGSHHAADLISLTQTLVGRPGLNVDPRQVYVAGLSSGAAMSLELGCTAPDLFAGVAAIAGPSVGSQQMMATMTPLSGNVQAATIKCRQLAGDKAKFFASQIVNVAYGNMDKNGSNDRYPYSQWGDQSHAGQYSVIPVQWTHDNAESERQVLGTDAFSGPSKVDGGTEWNALAGGKVKLTKLEVADVGHAWPAGAKAPPRFDAGLWIAQSGMNFPAYIADWFLKNNLRTGDQPPAPEPTPTPGPTAWKCLDHQAPNVQHVMSGRAYDYWGWAYAKGSNQMMGLDNMFLVTNVSEPQKGFYMLGTCK